MVLAELITHLLSMEKIVGPNVQVKMYDIDENVELVGVLCSEKEGKPSIVLE